jgi:hypothetical protein
VKSCNVSFGEIDAYYARLQRQGFGTLSYFNVFEFGTNATNITGVKGWRNASSYLAESLDDAELSDAWGPMQGSAPFHTWQSGVILDPAVPS